MLKVAVLTASDTRTRETDGSGSWISDRLVAAGHEITDRRICRDDATEIEAALRQQQQLGVDAIVVTGGTGIAPRDRTPEAVGSFCTLLLPGFGELFRQLSFAEIGARSMSSRAVAGLRETTLVFALPGSMAACRLGIEQLILPELEHLVTMARGQAHGD